jgi:Uma2 family endonuclease
MSLGITVNEQVSIPAWVTDLKTFCRWTRSADYPERGRFAYLGGELWMDLSMERQAHNQIKTCTGAVLTLLAKQEETGLYYGDGMQLLNPEAGLVTEPDGMYVSYRNLEAKRVRLRRGDESLEVLGSPDMTLEVVSSTSVLKDTKLLPRLYWEAKVAEFWRVDSRLEEPELDVFRRSSSKYVTVRKNAGWVKSKVFGKEFRLVRRAGPHGVSDFTLEVR